MQYFPYGDRLLNPHNWDNGSIESTGTKAIVEALHRLADEVHNLKISLKG